MSNILSISNVSRIKTQEMINASIVSQNLSQYTTDAEVLALIAANASSLSHNLRHQTGGADEISIAGLLGQHAVPLVNSAYGVLPVATIFDTPPSNLSNITDGDLSTVTGTGTKVLGAAGTVGIIDITLPSPGIYLVGIKTGIWSTTGQITVNIQGNVDGVNYFASGTASQIKTTTTEVVSNSISTILTCNIIRILVSTSVAATGNIKIYELFAYKLA